MGTGQTVGSGNNGQESCLSPCPGAAVAFTHMHSLRTVQRIIAVNLPKGLLSPSLWTSVSSQAVIQAKAGWTLPG